MTLMRQTFVTQVVNGSPVVPPQQELYCDFDENGIPYDGCGYCIIGPFNPTQPTCIIRIGTSPEKQAEREADPSYLHMEEL